MTKKLTPVMQQYLKVKKEHPSRLVFFRIGDFYELFFDDAQKASELLDITLTGRGQNDDRIPMAGVPHHSAQSYLKKIVDLGHSAVVCEQVDNPAGSHLPMDREVSQILTPGTVFDEAYLDQKSHNFIASYVVQGSKAALTWCDLCRGQVYWQTGTQTQILHRLAILDVKELLIREDYSCQSLDTMASFIERRRIWEFSIDEHLTNVLKILKVPTFSALNIDCKLTLSALVALINYCCVNTQSELLIKKVLPFCPDDELIIDNQTRQHLELDSQGNNGLYSLLNLTVTAMGSRRFQSCYRYPTRCRKTLSSRHTHIEFWLNHPDLSICFGKTMKKICDIDRHLAMVLKRSLTPRQLGRLIESLLVVIGSQETLFDRITTLKLETDPIKNLCQSIHSQLADTLPNNLRDGQVFKPTATDELQHYKSLLENQESHLQQYQETLQNHCHFPLKVQSNKVHGFYIEVSKTHSDKVPSNFIRKQTLKNVERYITDELKDLEEQCYSALSQIVELEQELFESILSTIIEHASSIEDIATKIAQLDTSYAFALCASKYSLSPPQFHEQKYFCVEKGRHLLVEHFNSQEPFIENDLQLTQDKSFLFITGPNMGGKSTYMRQQALIIFLSAIGSYVPADKAFIPDVDRVFTRIGAHDKIAKGQSTFMVEMVEAAQILQQATERSLIIMDEIGRGTSTFDGMALAKAICQYIIEKIGCLTLFATHYHDLISLSESYPAIALTHMGHILEKERIYFTYKLKSGPCYQSFGLHVAHLAGLPLCLLQQARQYQLEYQQQHEIGSQEVCSLKSELAQLNLEEISPRKAHEILEKFQLEHSF